MSSVPTDYQKMEAEYARLQGELQEAVMLQSLLLPPEKTLDQLRWQQALDLVYYCRPSAGLGGDYLSVLPISATETVVIMGDVSGHGVTAALYTFALHTLLEDRTLYACPPGEILERVNARLHPLLLEGKFATLFLGIIDTARDELRYAAAASPRPVLVSGGVPSLLETKGFLLGPLCESNYVTHRVPFGKGDALFLYSDALTETPSVRGDCLDETELMRLLVGQQGATATVTVKSILSYFFSEYSPNPPDDLSLLACCR